MIVTHFRTLIFVVLAVAFCTGGTLAQDSKSKSAKALEVSEDDGLSVLLKHLPEWEKVKTQAKFINDGPKLREAFGDREVLKTIDFAGGTEAASANYAEGKLLLVEFTNPQASIDVDQRITQQIGQARAEGLTAYRRIGNYNAFVFDGADEAAANALLDQITYQKSVQWLGEDPFLLKKIERYFVTTTRDIFISTVIFIVGGIGGAILTGILAGFLYFRFRDQRRHRTAAFSDAGGLTRLNLDELTPKIGD